MDSDLGGEREPSTHAPQRQELKAAVISVDDRLKEAVYNSLGQGDLPMQLDLEISAAAGPLEPEHLERLRSGRPDVIILDMDGDPDRAIRAVTLLASAHPGVALVGVGPDLDSVHLLNAMRAGLVEYVPRPAEAPHIHDALARVMRKRGWADTHQTRRNGKLLSFFSAKGGAGSTSVVTNVGIELHRLTGRRTLLVDLDLELGEIASHLGVRPRFHFVDLVRNFHRMDADLLASYIESHESGVQVLSAPFEPELREEVTFDQIGRILGFLRNHYDYVLVDTSKSLAPPALAALQAADQIFLVTNMDVPSLRNLKRCLPILDRLTAGDVGRMRLVVNRFNPKSLVQLSDLEEALGIDVHWTLTNDFQTVIHAISTGQPLVLEGNSRFAAELKELAVDIAHGPGHTGREKPSLVERFLSRIRPGPNGSRTPLESGPLEVTSHG